MAPNEAGLVPSASTAFRSTQRTVDQHKHLPAGPRVWRDDRTNAGNRPSQDGRTDHPTRPDIDRCLTPLAPTSRVTSARNSTSFGNGLRQPQRSRSSGVRFQRRVDPVFQGRSAVGRPVPVEPVPHARHRVLRRKGRCPESRAPAADLIRPRRRPQLDPRRRCCRMHSRWLHSRSCGGATSARPGPLDSPNGSAIRLSIRERGATSTRSSRTPQPGWAPSRDGPPSITPFEKRWIRYVLPRLPTEPGQGVSRDDRLRSPVHPLGAPRPNPIQPGRRVPVERTDPERQERRSVGRPRLQEGRTARRPNHRIVPAERTEGPPTGLVE